MYIYNIIYDIYTIFLYFLRNKYLFLKRKKEIIEILFLILRIEFVIKIIYFP